MNIYTNIGVMILFAFYGSYFVKMLIQSKSGIKTDRMARGSKTIRTFTIELILKIITFLMAIIQFVSILFIDKLSLLIQNSLVRDIGIIISSLGIVVFITAMATMHDSWRAGIDNTQKTKIITVEIYKYSRNPAFVGFDLFYIGEALIFSNVFNIIFACVSILMLHLQILEEEKSLPVVFGNEYLSYREKTCRYFGTK
ncbi:methyltransferase family protein [Haloimpatiens massiliensis]|uniref:methyltransferase family protein n=1 Tax=Haloimpatiens massiliensis TaxID=1658110 RepID=UPI000C827B07|nr:methyltransferase [Haloimpatiens massiliensis]